MSSTAEQRNRLPTGLKPVSYDLTLAPNLVECTFTGNVCATFIAVEEGVRSVVLHAADLNIDTTAVTVSHVSSANKETDSSPAKKSKGKLANLLGSNRSSTKATAVEAPLVGSVQVSLETERLEVHLAKNSVPFVKGETYQVTVSFRGILNDRLIGFYRSTYVVRDETKSPGEEGYEVSRNMATTQFEACDARRAFPCWDEPSLRAVFNITIIVPKSELTLCALSNMPVQSEEYCRDGSRKISFFPTPPLSTYLVAFVVAELEKVTMLGPRGLPVSVYGTPGQRDKMDFACKVGVGAIRELENLFGIDYPLPKLDLIAIADFSIGAMENMGLVTFRSAAILVDDKQSGPETKIRVASIISHELSHLWFGDLVSIEWWSQLWLKEGFATYFGWYVTDALFKEWEVWNIFVANTTKGALAIDALSSSHPVEVPVETENQINECFDAISYNKGASILRMLGQFLNAERLRKGLQLYLGRHQYQSATTKMLWDALEESSGVPVTKIMPCWTQQQGYPMLTVSQTATGKFKVEQQHFVPSNEKSERMWEIPVFVSGYGNIQDNFVMSTMETEFEFKQLNIDDWVSFNNEQCGFYRVRYSSDMLQKLGKAIHDQETSGIPTTTRFGIQDDAFALSKFGYLELRKALELLPCFIGETQLSIWESLLNKTSIVRKILRGSTEELKQKFNSFIIGLLLPVLDKLGGFQVPDVEDPSRTSLRSLLIGHLVGAGHTETVSQCLGLFDDMEKTPIHPSLVKLVLQTAVSERGEEVYEQVLDMYMKLDLQEAKLRCVAALGAAVDDKLALRTLDLGLSDKVRSQDVATVFGAVCNSNPNGYKLVWQYLQDNWTEIDARYGTGGSKLLGRFVTMLGNAMATVEDADKMEEFFKKHPAPAATQAIAQSLENIRATAAWIDRDEAGAIDWVSSL